MMNNLLEVPDEMFGAVVGGNSTSGNMTGSQ